MKSDHRFDDVQGKVNQTVAAIAGVDASRINGQMELIMDLNLDSLALFEIVIDLEEYFGLRISDEDVDRIKTLDDIVQFIKNHEPTGRFGKRS
jgi:acyl carrier protein